MAVDGWEQLSRNHPQSTHLDQRLAAAYVNCKDPNQTVSGLIALLDKQPNNAEFQDNLSQAFARLCESSRAVEGWTGLVKRHLDVGTLMNRLAEALTALDDPDVAMATWWELLKANPIKLLILRQFWVACNRKQGRSREFRSSIIGVLYFGWICVLNFIADECLKYGIEDVDWWPLAAEDDIMNCRPYMVKKDWYDVIFSSEQ